MGNKMSSLAAIQLTASAVALSALLAISRNRRSIQAFIMNNGILLLEKVNNNPFLQAFAIPSGFAFVMYVFRTIWHQLYSRIKLFLYCSVSISSKDQNFTAVVDFVSKLQEEDVSLIEAETKKIKFSRKQWIRRWNGIGDRKPPEMEYRPTKSGAMTTFLYKGTRILMRRSSGQLITVGHSRQPLELEKLRLMTWAGNVSLLKDLITDALAATFEEESDETKVFILSSSRWLGGWEQALTKERRPKGSIVLDGSTAENIIKDARTFLGSREWYMDRGIPHRRGYLLHGPPGCGKTSFVQVLAGVLKLDLCMLSLSASGLNDSKLAANFRDAPESSIILLEDVDAVFVDREVQKDRSGGTGVSFSGLLNAIDGVASQEGRLFFMTSNYPEKLDSALVRPGRCDVKIELRCASRNQMRRLFLRFFADEHALAERFAASLPEFELSMAQLQGHLLEHRNCAEDAINFVPSLLKTNKTSKVKKLSVYDHLKRVGLERLAALFEMHGFAVVDDLSGLSVSTVKQWDVELRYNTLEAERLDRLLKEDKKLMENDYPLASISGIRQAFFAAYPANRMKHLLEGPPPRQARLQRQNSIDQACDTALSAASARVPSVSSDADVVVQRLEELAKELSAKLSFNNNPGEDDEHEIVRGRGRVSLWQLRWLLTQNADPEMAVRNADALMAKRTNAERTPRFMSSFEWLSRAGHPEVWYLAEDAGYMLAADLMTLTKKELKELKLSGNVTKKFVVLCKNDPASKNITCGLLRPDRHAIRRAFQLAYPDCTFDQMAEFARVATDPFGRGRISKIQLELYLYDDQKKAEDQKQSTPRSGIEQKEPDLGQNFVTERPRRFASATEAVAACRQALAKSMQRCPRPKPKKKKRVTAWVHKMLKRADKDLVDNAKSFINAGLSKAEDVLAEPLLTDKDLETMGVSKLGHRRKIVKLIKSISAGADDGVLKEGDAIRSKFGDGRVKSHRDTDDMYEIDLSWGTMYALEENDSIERVVPGPVTNDDPDVPAPVTNDDPDVPAPVTNDDPDDDRSEITEAKKIFG